VGTNPASPVVDRHQKLIDEALEKARGLGKTDGYEWVVKTTERLLPDRTKELLSEKAEEKVIRIGVFKTEPARVVAQKGLTINLGNFESARVTVGFEIPCYVEEVKEIESVTNGLIEDRLQREVLDIRGKDIRPGFESKRAAGAPA